MAVFRIAARTVLHLGAELISSDQIALYELIKNAFDAKSQEVNIDIIIRIPQVQYERLRKTLREGGIVRHRVGIHSITDIKRNIIDSLDASAPFLNNFKSRVQNCDSVVELVDVLDSANYIDIKDTGEGMTLNDLQDVYLTIGTRSRHEERERHRRLSSLEENSNEVVRPVLGEKGVGRLSAMRLGQRLRVKSKKIGNEYWNILNIDWSKFSHDSDELLEEVDAINLRQGETQVDSNLSGTTLRIFGLTSEWTATKLEEVILPEFSKLTDPFTPEKRYPIKLRFNKDDVKITRFDKVLFNLAHAYVEAEFSIGNGKPKLEGKVDYKQWKKAKKFSYSSDDLLHICDLKNLEELNALGSFKMMFYWFNRRLIKGIDGLGTQKQLRELIAQWSGGLMVFRDGFRVNPYGGENDDWLNLDKRAFRSIGFKLNRRQVVGKVDISAINNPALRDQTNREGLQKNAEFLMLQTLLQFVLFNEFKVFTDFIDDEMKVIERVSLKTLDERLESQEESMRKNLETLVREFRIPRNAPAIRDLEDTVESIRDLLGKAKQLAEMHEDDKTKYLHLAALGLMAEILAHELNRASSNVIVALKEIDIAEVPLQLGHQLHSLSSQMKTLQKRLRILDPLSTRGRQVKESFNLVSWVEENMSAHKAQFDRHNIKYNFVVKPNKHAELNIKAVKGMIVQILENLNDNSVYWIKEYKKSHPYYKPEITVIIDTNSSKLFFIDNGPGIPPERSEEVFLPFFSTKPFKLGKGLGLFISREIAEYNNARLYLSKDSKDFGNSNTFVLDLGS